MKRRTRIYYIAQQRVLIWEQYQKGTSLNHIARLFDRHHSSVCRIISESGGIHLKDRRRANTHLTIEEREGISRGSISANLSVREIANKLQRSPSTICREVNRNGDYDRYRAVNA